MVTGGRCHGPGCPWPAKIGYFCSESHQSAWNAQYWREAPTLDDKLAAAISPVQADLEQQLATQSAIPAAEFTVAEVARIAESLRSTPRPEPAKLTEEQLAALRQALPDRPGWTPNAQVNAFDGVPVEIVETVEESTPYLLERRAQFKRAAVVAGRGMTWRPAGVPFRVDPEAVLTNANAKDPQVTPPNPQVGFDVHRVDMQELRSPRRRWWRWRR